MNCAFEQCGRGVYALGLCNGHYQQQHKGIPLKPLRLRNDSRDFCDFASCQKGPKSQGLCSGHYAQLRAGKQLTSLLPQEAKVEWDAQAVIAAAIQSGDCLLFKPHWKAKYPRVRVNGEGISAHRLVFEDAFGELAPGTTVHHICANPKCVNPQHLERASSAENTLEMLARRDYEAEIAALKARTADLEERVAYLEALLDNEQVA